MPEKRNLKIGKQLIEKIEEIAKEKQLEQIELSTSTYRKDAHRFYERQGYEKLHYNYTKALDTNRHLFFTSFTHSHATIKLKRW